MNTEHEEQECPHTEKERGGCSTCAGSGEGMHDGTVCGTCNGSGKSSKWYCVECEECVNDD